MGLLELIIHDGLLNEIRKVKNTRFDYGAIDKLHIIGIPYVNGSTLLAKQELKDFLKSFRYVNVNAVISLNRSVEYILF